MRSPRLLTRHSWLWGLLLAVAGISGGWVAESISQTNPEDAHGIVCSSPSEVPCQVAEPSPSLQSHTWILGAGVGVLGVGAIALIGRTTPNPLRLRKSSQMTKICSQGKASGAIADESMDGSGLSSDRASHYPIDLCQLRSPDMKLSQKQRDVLQCLWVMAAIAPSVTPSPASSCSQHTTWGWLTKTLQSSSLALDSICAVLSDMGFSQQTIHTARHIALGCQKLE